MACIRTFKPERKAGTTLAVFNFFIFFLHFEYCVAIDIRKNATFFKKRLATWWSFYGDK